MNNYKINFFIRHLYFYDFFEGIVQTFIYIFINNLSGPTPRWIKKMSLKRNFIKNVTTIETGTYYGQMTKFFSKFSLNVISIEASINHYNAIIDNLNNFNNVKILYGSSDVMLFNILSKSPSIINIFLDAHYSGGNTYMGNDLTPIRNELFAIKSNLNKFDKIVIAIDDVRCFKIGFENYPSIYELVEYAKDLGFSFLIEYDILYFFCGFDDV